MRLVEEADFTINQSEENIYCDSLKWAEEYLLRQGPLEYFVHHNTLHAFETMPFIEALFKAKELHLAKTHMNIQWYLEQYKSGRIIDADLKFSIEKNFGKDFSFLQILNWEDQKLEEDQDFEKIEFLKEYFKGLGVQGNNSEFFQITTYWDHTKSKFRSKGLKKNLETLKYKFLAAFFDKGTAYWEMEERKRGFSHCFKSFIDFLPSSKINTALKESFAKLNENDDLNKAIENFQQELNIPEQYLKNYLFQVLNESKGWSGLVLSLNENNNFNPTQINIPKDDYIRFCLIFNLAGYLCLHHQKDLKAFNYKVRKTRNRDYDILSFLYDEINKETKHHGETQRIFLLNKDQISQLTYKSIITLWQEAYEAHLFFNLVRAHEKSTPAIKKELKLQVVTCIDDREESTRRHFEAYDNSIETFGYAGHFGLNIKYKSLRDAHFRALCPVNAIPSKYVFEEVLPGEKIDFKLLARIKHFLFHNSNLPFVGSFLSLFLGPFTGMLFLFENLAPKTVHELRKKLKKWMYPRVRTRLNFAQEEGRDLEGFSDQELAAAAFTMISVTGLNKNFAEVVYLCGHGSKSMNNPHGAAYNCGACAGGKGAPNARLMALALNKAEVRIILKEKGIIIPDSTLFVGGYHCTSTGKLLVFDEENLPLQGRLFLHEACEYVEKNESKERMRKFENVSLEVTPDQAFLAAQNRSYDFSQPRPEYGHNTNAFCIVGKRQTSERLFLDRRAFLVSYDEDNDLEGDNLLGLLSAVIPVCAGINLEYYFSFVDQENFGAGVKQAHNVTSLMGVMNGYQSDLQMGLPWQMVEIHEPARITFLIESSREKFERVLEKNKEVRNLVKNEWVIVILKDKEGDYHRYGPNGATKLHTPYKPLIERKTSEEIYKGTREILEVSLIGGGK